MAKDKKVEQITDMEVDFAQWFTDVCTKAELVDYSGVKGLFIMRPYGYAIWENIMSYLDGRFKELGHENVAAARNCRNAFACAPLPRPCSVITGAMSFTPIVIFP